jgi:RNA polymerase sigma-70 factor (ECF subfamily)
MDDLQIIELYNARSEEAIAQTDRKYGGFCRAVSGRILRREQDQEECVQDAYLRAWATIPPEMPRSLRAYLACLTRNVSISRWRSEHAEKRGGRELMLSLEELGDCVPAERNDPAQAADAQLLSEILNRFVGSLREADRKFFLQRYWYFCSIREIALGAGVGESRVKVSLYRSREKLRVLLEQEGIRL